MASEQTAQQTELDKKIDAMTPEQLVAWRNARKVLKAKYAASKIAREEVIAAQQAVKNILDEVVIS
jgi:hypothetical protein